MQRIEILRQQIRLMNVEYGGQLLGPVTVSIGIALYPDHGATTDEVISAADQALYRAKREGRDRVFAFASETMV